jgi:hypothetical protein
MNSASVYREYTPLASQGIRTGHSSDFHAEHASELSGLAIPCGGRSSSFLELGNPGSRSSSRTSMGARDVPVALTRGQQSMADSERATGYYANVVHTWLLRYPCSLRRCQKRKMLVIAHAIVLGGADFRASPTWSRLGISSWHPEPSGLVRVASHGHHVICNIGLAEEKWFESM